MQLSMDITDRDSKTSSSITSRSVEGDHDDQFALTESVTESPGLSEDLHDNVSVISDVFSASSKAKKYDVKKLSATVHKLKQENSALRESLAMINATDTALLKNKLRGANSDIIRLRQHNAELRDRNQVLEERLAALLATEPRDAGVRLQQLLAQRRQQQQSANADEGLGAISGQPAGAREEEEGEEVRRLQRKLRHADKLLQSYEIKIKLMEDAKTEPSAVPSSSGVVFAVPLDDRPPPEQPPQQQQLALERAADQRTIHELAQEVKRLVALLPREVVEEDEEVVKEESDREDRQIPGPGRVSVDVGTDKPLSAAQAAPPPGESAHREESSWTTTGLLVILPAVLGVLAVFAFTVLRLLPHWQKLQRLLGG